MKIEKPVNWSLENAIYNYFKHGYKDGDLISHEWLKWALDLPAAMTAENQIIKMERIAQFKNALLEEHSIYIDSVRGKGYRVVPPNDQAYVASSNAGKEVLKSLKTCEKRLKHTRTELLNIEEAKRHTDTQIRIAGMTAMMNRGKRDVFKLFEEKTDK